MRQLLAFVLIAGISFALAPDPSVLGPAGIAGVLGGAIIGLLYMLSKVFQDASLEAHAKELLRELAAGAVVVFVVYCLVFGSLDLLPILTGQPDVGAIVVDKLDNYTEALAKDYEMAIKVTNRVGMVSSYFYSRTLGYIFYFGAMQSPYQGMAGLRIALTHLANEMGNGIMMYETMKMLQYFFSAISSLIFAIGFALRMIPFTRKAGGMVMAIGFAAAVLYPYAVYLATLLHDQIISDAESGGVKIHSQVTAGDLDKITLDLPDFLVEVCTNDFIRIFTSLNEWGWWAIICIPYCTILLVSCISIAMSTCAAEASACLVGYAACYAACFIPQLSSCYSQFYNCIVPVFGTCWNTISYRFYTGVQAAFVLASTIAAVTASKQIEGAIGGNVGEIYDIVMQRLVLPVSAAAALPVMEAVFVGIIVIVGARALSGIFGGEIQIAGLGRLV